jgi:hypothetical protein
MVIGMLTPDGWFDRSRIGGMRTRLKPFPAIVQMLPAWSGMLIDRLRVIS